MLRVPRILIEGAGWAETFLVGIPKEVIPAMRKAFSNLCTSPSGVLFENALLQVGVKIA